MAKRSSDLSVSAVTVRLVKQVVKVRVLPVEARGGGPGGHAARLAIRRRHGCRRRCMPMEYCASMRCRSASTPSCKERFGLSAQPAVRVIGKVADAYTTLRANVEAGNYGPPGSQRRRNSGGEHRSCSAPMRPSRSMRGACPGRCPEQVGGREATVSIWTTHGRMQERARSWPRHCEIWCCCGPARSERPTWCAGTASGICYATVEAPAAPLTEPDQRIRRGGSWASSTSPPPATVTRAAGAQLNRYRKRQLNLRKRLQAKKTSHRRGGC